MLSYKEFVGQSSKNLEGEESLDRYNEYVQNYTNDAKQNYFKQHIDEEWFFSRFLSDEVSKANEQKRQLAAQLIEDLESVSASEDPNYFNCLASHKYLFVNRLPPTLTKESFLNILKEFPVVDMFFSDAAFYPPQDFDRSVWIRFADEYSLNSCFSRFCGRIIKYSFLTNEKVEAQKDFVFNCTITPMKQSRSIPIDHDHSSLEDHFKHLQEVIRKMDQQSAITNGFLPLIESNFGLSDSVMLADYYLRRIHFYSYFGGKQYATYGQLYSSDGPFICFKVQDPSPETKDVINELGEEIVHYASVHWNEQVLDNYRKQMQFLVQLDRTLAAADKNDDVSVYYKDFAKEHSAMKRHQGSDVNTCNLCEKMFVSMDFLEKHLSSKHKDLLDDYVQMRTLKDRALALYLSSDVYLPLPKPVNQTTTERSEPLKPIAGTTLDSLPDPTPPGAFQRRPFGGRGRVYVDKDAQTSQKYAMPETKSKIIYDF